MLAVDRDAAQLVPQHRGVSGNGWTQRTTTRTDEPGVMQSARVGRHTTSTRAVTSWSPRDTIAVILGLDGESIDLIGVECRRDHKTALIALKRAVELALSGLEAS